MRFGPTKSDWLLAIISAAFTASGVALAIGKSEKAGIAVATFFGGCLAVALWMLVGKIRTERHTHATSVEVPGGVPMRSRPTPTLVIAAGLVVVGFTGGWAGGQIGLVFVTISYAIGALGAVLLILFPLGVFPRPFIQFEPEGLRFGQRHYSFVLEWDNIAQVAPGDVGGHDAVLITVRDMGRFMETVVTSGPKELATKRLTKSIRSNRSWFGCDIAIMPFQFGTDLALLVGAMQRYVTDADARRSLSTKISIPAST